jgi:hypothetical protein
MRLALAVLLGTAAPLWADEPCAAARAAVVQELTDLARWCAKCQVYLDRDLTYELVLRIDPDHREARKWLKYVFRDGRWVRTSTYRPPRNHNEAAHAEFLRRRAAISRTFGDAAFAEVTREGEQWPA